MFKLGLSSVIIEAMSTFDLEDRLVAFAITILNITDRLPKNVNGSVLAKQLARSGTSSALHYGEAQAAESRKDFIHKMKVVLKELKETSICLKLIGSTDLLNNQTNVEQIQQECLELIFIFLSSIKTAEQNLRNNS